MPTEDEELTESGLALRIPGPPEQHLRAVAFFDKALTINPANARASFFRGSALYDLGRVDEAVRAFVLTISIKPQGKWAEDAWFHHALALSEKACSKFFLSQNSGIMAQ